MLIVRNEDLARLRREGYTVQVVRGNGVHLLVHDVPYVNAQRQVRRGTLVAPLELNAEQTTSPIANHQAWFIGEHPCNADGTKLTEIQHATADSAFGDGITVNHSFSMKPRNGGQYVDNYQKFTRYIRVISAPADVIEPGIRATVFKPVPEDSDDSVFHYSNTATSKVGIAAASEKLAVKRIAIIGLGGTGSYVLDAIAKTPVRAIHLYDGDIFIQHNAFRSPGAPGLADLTAPKKVDYFSGIYSKMHRHIIPHAFYIDEQTVKELEGFDFVFLCIDRGSARKMITDALHAMGVPYIDTGIGVHKTSTDQLGGQVRVTLANRPPEDDVYASNIQIAELNALSAIMAVIRWKKFVGFLVDEGSEFHAVYRIASGTIIRADLP